MLAPVLVAPVAPVLVAPPPVRQAVALRVFLPLAAALPQSAPEQELAQLLDVTQDIEVLGAVYRVPSTRIVAARDAITQQAARELVAIDVPTVGLPLYQPRVAPIVEELYRVLGIGTVNLVEGLITYTVLADHVDRARGLLRPEEGPVPRAPRLDVPLNPGLSDYYVGDLTPAARAVAAMFGQRFYRVLDTAGAIYHVAAGSLVATLDRLRTCIAL